jgi:hypothetical protein
MREKSLNTYKLLIIRVHHSLNEYQWDPMKQLRGLTFMYILFDNSEIVRWSCWATPRGNINTVWYFLRSEMKQTMMFWLLSYLIFFEDALKIVSNSKNLLFVLTRCFYSPYNCLKFKNLLPVLSKTFFVSFIHVQSIVEVFFLFTFLLPWYNFSSTFMRKQRT